MADKSKFEEPGNKCYSVRDMLTQERILTATREMIYIQQYLLKTLPDKEYQNVEMIFDTAIASLLVHDLAVDIREIHRKEDMSQEENKKRGMSSDD